MFPAPSRVVLDANVLFPFSLRDTLLRAAERGLFQLDDLLAGLAKTAPEFVDLVTMHRR